MSIVLTKAALALKNAEKNFKVTKYETHKPKKKRDDVELGSRVSGVVEAPCLSNKELDLKRIRHEIVKFGMSGFDTTKKEEAKIALAVSLGAKPPKKQYLNYKELMQKTKEEKQKQKEEKELMISRSIMQSTGKKKKKKIVHDVGHFLDSYGKVQKKDIHKNKETVKKKKIKKML